MNPTHKPTILFLDDFEHCFEGYPAIEALRPRANLTIHTQSLRGDALAQALGSAEVVVLMRDRTPFGPAELDLSKNLKLLIYTGNRNGLLDEQACQARGIPVLNTEFGPTKAATAELTWGLILASVKRLETGFQAMRSPQGGWREGLHFPGLCDVLEGETLGLVGLGQIGQRVAKVGSALGMRILAWSPNLTPDRAQAGGAEYASFGDLMGESKVVSLHMVLSASTRGMINAAALAKMRPDGLLVNTSRSGLVVESDLVAALQAGRPGYAALDVFDTEPLPAGHPLRGLANATLSPHLGFVANPVYDIFAQTVAKHLENWLAAA